MSHIIGFLLVTLAQILMPIKIGTFFQNKLRPTISPSLCDYHHHHITVSLASLYCHQCPSWHDVKSAECPQYLYLWHYLLIFMSPANTLISNQGDRLLWLLVGAGMEPLPGSLSAAGNWSGRLWWERATLIMAVNIGEAVGCPLPSKSPWFNGRKGDWSLIISYPLLPC